MTHPLVVTKEVSGAEPPTLLCDKAVQNFRRDKPLQPPPSARPRGRLAPSPTGRLHLGNAFAFLMAWLSIRKQGGALVLRMEDIDPDRSRPAFAEEIIRDLQWLGIDWDEGPNAALTKDEAEEGPYGPYTQSLRLPLYQGILDTLEKEGLVYPCFCTRKELRTLASAPHIGDEGVPYPGTCWGLSAEARAAFTAQGRRPALRIHTEEAVRFAAGLRNSGPSPAPCPPAGPILCPTDSGETMSLCFNDAVLGRQAFTIKDCGGDFALRRSDGVFAYQLAVVADDAAMGITEVVRGNDLLLSTPRQILIFSLLGAQPPQYAHLPLVHDEKGERLAKRHKGLELCALREAGISPKAVVGYLGFLAGFLSEAQPVKPHDLLKEFSLTGLHGRHLQIPEYLTEVLRRL